MVRCFLALDPPKEILGEVEKIQSRLKNLLRGEIRWVRPEGIHLTLKFFGDVAEDVIPRISAVVETTAAATAPLSLSVGGVGVFPDLRRPRVLWLGMNGDIERLLKFQKELDDALMTIDFPAEERPFRPHLTMGRIKSPQGLIGLAKVLEKGEEHGAGNFIASGIGLIQSELKPPGAVYTQLKWFPFTGENGK